MIKHIQKQIKEIQDIIEFRMNFYSSMVKLIDDFQKKMEKFQKSKNKKKA